MPSLPYKERSALLILLSLPLSHTGLFSQLYFPQRFSQRMVNGTSHRYLRSTYGPLRPMVDKQPRLKGKPISPCNLGKNCAPLWLTLSLNELKRTNSHYLSGQITLWLAPPGTLYSLGLCFEPYTYQLSLPLGRSLGVSLALLDSRAKILDPFYPT